MQALELLDVFITPFEKNEIPYFVTGSITAIFYGEPRLTHDIDIVVRLSHNDFAKITKLFPLQDYDCPSEDIMKIENNRRPYGHFNLIHHNSGFRADIYTDAADELHEWGFKNKKQVELTPALSLWLAPPEYVIIRKLEFFRNGGSEKHLSDIKKMLPQVETNLDQSFLQEQFLSREMTDIWKKFRRSF